MKTEMTDDEILNNAATKALQELHLPNNGCLDNLTVVRLWTELYACCGGDVGLMRHWLNNPNTHLEFIPASRLDDAQSVEKIINYLEYMRGE